MDLSHLIKGAPELLGQLKGLNLSDSHIENMAGEIGSQLGGADGFDFTDLLTNLNADNFLGNIDVASLAERVQISPEIAQQALGFIAPVVESFGGGQGGILGKLVGGFFGRK